MSDEDELGVPPPLAGWIHEVSGDVEAPDNVVFLVGYWGESSVRSDNDPHFRFYFSPSLQHYIDVPQSAILKTQAVPDQRSALGARFSWIDGEARLIFGPADGTRLIATYAEGRAWSQERGLLLPADRGDGEHPFMVGVGHSDLVQC